MQIPNDLNDTEKQLCECVLLLMSALMAEQMLGFVTETAMSNISIGISGKILANIIGDQPYTQQEFARFGLDTINKYQHLLEE